MIVRSLTAAWRAGYARPFFAIVALNVIVLVGVTFPRAVAERRLSAEAAGLREQIEAQRKASDSIRHQNDVVKANERETQQFYGEVVQGRDAFASTLTWLLQTANDLGVRSSRQTFAPKAVKGADLTAFEITMPVSGTYQQLGAFLQKLEKAREFVVVKQVSMKSRSVDTGGDLDITIDAYFRPERSKP